jgi:hypothetical protein
MARYIGEAVTAVQTTNERLSEAEVNRFAGEIALKSPRPDTAKAEEYFERALSVARQQRAKSWELRAAMSLARLWRSQGKAQQARDLLAPVYGWFTEGFDTRDLKEAKALLEELVGIAARTKRRLQSPVAMLNKSGDSVRRHRKRAKFPWLRSLGLGKHEAAFRKSGTDQLVLPNLAQEQPKEIDVGPVV